MTSLDRARCLAQAESLIKQANFTREDSARVDSLLRLAEQLPASPTPANTEREIRAESAYDQLFYNWLRSGEKHLLPAMHEELRAVSYSPETTVIDGSGGELVPQGFQNALLEVMKATDGLYAAATLVLTATGAAFSHPMVDDADSEAEIVNENSAEPDGVVAFGDVAWGRCPKWSSGWSLVPLELLQDSLYDLPGVLAKIFGIRLSRGIGRQFVTTMLASGQSALTSGSSGAVTGDELLALMTSVDPIYAAAGSWLMNFSTYLAILKLAAGASGPYLFPATVDAAGTPLLLGRKVLICPSMANLGAGTKAVAYGDCSQFLRREVTNSLRLMIARERWLERAQFGYQAHIRVDGAMIVSGGDPSDINAPIKYITQKA